MNPIRNRIFASGVSSAVTPAGPLGSRSRFFVEHIGECDSYFGVIGGHGEFSHAAAAAATDELRRWGPSAAAEPTATEAFAEAHAAMKPALHAAAEAKYSCCGSVDVREEPDGTLTRKSMYGLPGRRPIRAGASAAILRLNGRQLTLAQVGDCQVLTVHESGDWDLISADHTANSLEEFERIWAETEKQPIVEFDRGRFVPPGAPRRPVFVLTGPNEFGPNAEGGYYVVNRLQEWASHLYTAEDRREALYLTRAIGDFHMRSAGVTCYPFITSRLLPATGRSWVLAGTKDFFDNYTYQELADRVLDLASRHYMDDEIAGRLVEEAMELGRAAYGEAVGSMAITVALMDPTPVVRVIMPITEGGIFSCCFTADQALKFAVETRHLGLGFALAAGKLRSSVPMGLGPAERLVRGI